MKISFVILHYNTLEMTKKCVNYIKKNIDTDNYIICIVDNGSSNGTGNELKKIYKNTDKVDIIINNENLGFAKGNNIGFRFLRDKYDPDYIVMLNNDVYLLETELLAKLKTEYNLSSFAVLGPMILTKDGICNINPIDHFKTVNQVIAFIKHYKRIFFLAKNNLFGLYQILKKMKDFIFCNSKSNIKEYIEKKYNVKLHGCFMVFSRKYIEKYDGLNEQTFLYMEEDILYFHMMQMHETTVYLPNIYIYHEEKGSTCNLYSDEKKRRLFRLKYIIESAEILLSLYERGISDETKIN